MDFPKAIMSISELAALGFPKAYLRCLVRIPGQDFAMKTIGGGKWLFDTGRLDRHLESQRRQTRKPGRPASGEQRHPAATQRGTAVKPVQAKQVQAVPRQPSRPPGGRRGLDISRLPADAPGSASCRSIMAADRMQQ